MDVMSKKTVIVTLIGIGSSILFLLAVMFQRHTLTVSVEESTLPLKGSSIELPDSVSTVLGESLSTKGVTLWIFFDTSCPNCIEEALMWNDLYARVNHRASVIAVARADRDQISRFIRRLAIRYPVISDPEGDIFRLFHVRKIPYSLVTGNGILELVPEDQDYLSSAFLRQVEEYLRLD